MSFLVCCVAIANPSSAKLFMLVLLLLLLIFVNPDVRLGGGGERVWAGATTPPLTVIGKYFNGNLNWINWVILIGIVIGDQI